MLSGKHHMFSAVYWFIVAFYAGFVKYRASHRQRHLSRHRRTCARPPNYHGQAAVDKRKRTRWSPETLKRLPGQRAPQFTRLIPVSVVVPDPVLRFFQSFLIFENTFSSVPNRA